MGTWRSELREGIRQRGFRKWYERELISGHAHLVLTVLSTLGLLGGFEVYDRQAPWTDQLVTLLAMLSSALIGGWALRRYLYRLMNAEVVANQAVCPQCQTYARFDLVAEQQPARDAVGVCCRQCGQRWLITR